MPLETTTQNINIVLRNEDFGEPILLKGEKYPYFYTRIGKWVEVTPTQLLATTNKLFIDDTNYIYKIESINQAIRFYIRPICFYNYFSDHRSYLMCDKVGAKDFLTSSLCSLSKCLFYTVAASINNYTYYNSYICKYENLNSKLKQALGELPAESIVNTVYLNGKFNAQQPHIEHINSGLYTVYNNIRLITLPAGTEQGTLLTEVDFSSVTNGLTLNSYYSNPTIDNTTNRKWNFDYASFNLSIKYIENIVDLDNTYLSYFPTYSRYVCVFRSGNPATYGSADHSTPYKTLSQYTYSAFEFFLAPVGEAS